MAVATLQKIHKNPGYFDGDQVKISRKQVGMIVQTANVALHSNTLVNVWFKVLSRGLPSCTDADACDPRELQQIVARAGLGDVQSGMFSKLNPIQ